MYKSKKGGFFFGKKKKQSRLNNTNNTNLFKPNSKQKGILSYIRRKLNERRTRRNYFKKSKKIRKQQIKNITNKTNNLVKKRSKQDNYRNRFYKNLTHDFMNKYDTRSLKHKRKIDQIIRYKGYKRGMAELKSLWNNYQKEKKNIGQNATFRDQHWINRVKLLTPKTNTHVYNPVTKSLVKRNRAKNLYSGREIAPARKNNQYWENSILKLEPGVITSI